VLLVATKCDISLDESLMVSQEEIEAWVHRNHIICDVMETRYKLSKLFIFSNSTNIYQQLSQREVWKERGRRLHANSSKNGKREAFNRRFVDSLCVAMIDH